MDQYEQLVIKLFQKRIIEFGEFPFKLHEEYPDFPKFLMKCNLRMPPNGKLTQEIVMEIGKLYVDIARCNNLKFDLIAGLPRAGDLLAKAFVSNRGAETYQLIVLQKEDFNFGKRKILPIIIGKYKPGNIVLGIDDVISLGGSKIEGITAFLLNNLYITDYICFMDWGLGGKEIIKKKYGIKILTAFSVENILLIGQKNGFVTEQKRIDIIRRRDDIKKCIEKEKLNILSA